MDKYKKKNKGDRSYCENYKGISLLSVAGKLYACVMLIIYGPSEAS